TKTIHFCYGHRLLNYNGKCRHLHGHNARVEIDVAAETLDSLGMAADFSDIKEKVKNWIDATLDHRLLLNVCDPIIPFLVETKEPHFVFAENPTAENIAKLIFDKTKEIGFNVKGVRLWETPDSCAVYTGCHPERSEGSRDSSLRSE
ncbi:MAG: 6-carboxytetrahydropterin synthase QueD, partial [Deltaproteobacteria bacterium]|nr:6-carboxytetrahydropterin synthase QueD [Deltaproteobacteria bacterium]